MKIRRLIGRVVFYGATLAFLNYYTLPLGTFAASEMLKRDDKDKRIQKVCKTDSYLEDIVSKINVEGCDALKLLKAAHAITSKWLSIDDNKSFFKEKKALEEGKALCKYYSTFTYSNFLYLTDKLGRPELKDKVRLCKGFVSESGGVDGGHAWLQVYSSDKWEDYETVMDFFKSDSEIDFGLLDVKISNSYVLGDETLSQSSFIHYENDKLVSYTNPSYSIESGIEARHFFKYVIKDCASNVKQRVDDGLKRLKERFKS